MPVFQSRKSILPTEEYKDREDTESLLSNSENGKPISQPPSRSSWRLIFILVGSHLTTAIFVAWFVSHWKLNLNQLCAAHTSYYSPILKDVDVKYSTTTYNGSFFHETIYRQDPSPEVDQAWQDLGVDYRAMRIPEEETLKSGITPSHVKIRPQYGGGAPANLQGLHNLHCLNLLRQTSHWNYDYYKSRGHGAFENEDHIVKVHTTHCMDMLRQRLMCEVDTGVLGQIWWSDNPEKSPHAFVDFNVHHVCKNFDAIRSWAEARQLPEADLTPEDFLNPPGGVVYSDIP